MYILQSNKNGSYYVGSCSDLEKRFTMHNQGLIKSTKRYSPWQKIYTEQYNSLSQARKREAQIKSWKKRGGY